MKFTKVTSTVQAPITAGIKGILSFLENLLVEIPHLQSFTVNHLGEVTYVWFAPENKEIGTVPEFLTELTTPYEMLRKVEISEVLSEEVGPAAMFYALFRNCAIDRLLPVCFAIGAESKLPEWLQLADTPVEALQRFTFGGCQVLVDENLPDDCLVLFASHARTAHYTDACKAYKIALVFGV